MRLVIAVMGLTGLLSAQSISGSWDTVRSLSAGSDVKVRTTSGETIRGSALSASADDIRIQAKQGETVIEKQRVERVEVRSGNKRLRNALIGVGAGVVVGVVVDQTLGVRLRNEGNESGRAAMYAVPIALLGALGGASPAYVTVYRVK